MRSRRKLKLEVVVVLPWRELLLLEVLPMHPRGGGRETELWKLLIFIAETLLDRCVCSPNQCVIRIRL
jgi:hypothetical protein